MSSRKLEDVREGIQHAHIARELGLTEQLLEAHPYELEEGESDDGVVYCWRLHWEDTAPNGVTVYGQPGSLWSEIQPGPYEGDDPN